mmetsp:Transcript_119509/g.234888  ORF Transcript_119509/g.234888 Transcript_119509/m.234888 type:complete len:220 (-) Transcript_119509:156-815(-)
MPLCVCRARVAARSLALLVLSAFAGHAASIVAQTPPDLADISARFDKIDSELNALSDRVTELQATVTQVQIVANDTKKGIQDSEDNLVSVRALAQTNAAVSGQLQAAFMQSQASFENATAELKTIKEVVEGLEMSAMEMGSDAETLGKKVGDLDLVMKDFLPGASSLRGRLDKAKAVLAEYKAKAAASALDPIINEKLTAAFLSATNRTKLLAETAAAQ